MNFTYAMEGDELVIRINTKGPRTLGPRSEIIASSGNFMKMPELGNGFYLNLMFGQSLKGKAKTDEK